MSPALRKELRQLGKVLQLLPNPILVEGHTDNVPIRASKKHSSNWALSVARADDVIHFFTEECGLSPSRFVAAVYGEYRPIADNDTLEGRAKNRRIEISLLREKNE